MVLNSAALADCDANDSSSENSVRDGKNEWLS
jgi:hypothetical protein